MRTVGTRGEGRCGRDGGLRSIPINGRPVDGLWLSLGAPMAVLRQTALGRGRRENTACRGRQSRTRAGATLRGRLGSAGGRSSGRRRCRQAGSGMARSRARARLNWVSQGQLWGRCRVRRRAERVIRPAREKNRRRRVLVVTTCSPRPVRAVQRARLCAHHLYRQPGGVGGETARRHVVQPHAVLQVSNGVLDLGMAAVVGLQPPGFPRPGR